MSCRVYVGNLPLDIKEREIDDLFYKYGRITDIEIKRPGRPPAYAFVNFDHPRDAEDAVYGRDGYYFDRERLRCEIAKSRGGRDRDRDRDRDRGGRGDRDRPARAPKQRSDFRVIVTGLPRGCSWQDLKDFFRTTGDVVYTNVENVGEDVEGIVEFACAADADRAVDKLDDTRFNSSRPNSDVIIRVRSDMPAGASSSKEEKRSYTPSRSRSRSDSRGRDKRSYSRSPSPRRSASRSRSRSPAREEAQSEAPAAGVEA